MIKRNMQHMWNKAFIDLGDLLDLKVNTEINGKSKKNAN